MNITMTAVSRQLIAGFAFGAASLAIHAAEQAPLERWRQYQGVSWDTPDAGRDPARFANSVNAPIAGLHFDAQGRAFVSTPRLVSADAPATLSILDTGATSGPARLTAFPSMEANAVKGDPRTSLRNVLGFYVDQRNGWLWALDQGIVAGEAEAPAGAQKIVVIDLASRKFVKTIVLDAVADRKGSFLNDIVVDEARRIAYISDSGLRSAPANKAGIIVADFDSGSARRVLDRHPAVLPQPGVKVVSHGAEVFPGQPLVLGINGIALSPDGATLYWTVTTGTRAYAAPTKTLYSPKSVRLLGEVGGNTDGIVTDRRGRLYITDVTRNGIVEYDPATSKMRLLAASEGVQWPDTPAIAPDGSLVFTASHLNGHFAGAIKPGQESYELWRLPLSATQAASK